MDIFVILFYSLLMNLDFRITADDFEDTEGQPFGYERFSRAKLTAALLREGLEANSKGLSGDALLTPSAKAVARYLEISPASIFNKGFGSYVEAVEQATGLIAIEHQGLILYGPDTIITEHLTGLSQPNKPS